MKKNFNKLAVAMMMIAGVMVSNNASAHDLFTSSKGETNELFPPTVNAIIDKACGKVSGVEYGKVSGVVSGKVSGVTSGKASGFNEACGVYVSVDKEFKGLDITRRRAAGYNEVAIIGPRVDLTSGFRDCKA